MPRPRSQNNFISIKKDDRYTRLRYKTKTGKPIWSSIVEYVNKIEIGKKLTRRSIHHAVFDVDIADHLLKCGDVSTIDTYRILLTNTGFLKKTDILGTYEKIKHIPDTATLTKLQKFSSCKDWRKWFVPFEEWIK